MQFIKTAIVAALAFASSTFAAPLEARQDELQPFQLKSLGSNTPSGRPGSYPWGQIKASIVDPNEHHLGTSDSDGSEIIAAAGNQGLNCTARWYTRGGDSPVGHPWPCDATEDGYWLMYIDAVDGQFSSTNFNVRFTRVAQVLYRAQSFEKTFEGSAHMAVGDNMSGSCGGSGVCGWGLKDEVKPFPIEISETSS